MPSGKNAWLTFLTFNLLIKIVILHALLAVSMPNILLVSQQLSSTRIFNVSILSCLTTQVYIQCMTYTVKHCFKTVVLTYLHVTIKVRSARMAIFANSFSAFWFSLYSQNNNEGGTEEHRFRNVGKASRVNCKSLIKSL